MLDINRYKGILVATEAKIHSFGWDNPSVVMSIYDGLDERLDEVMPVILEHEGYVSRLMFAPSDYIDGNPTVGLLNFAYNISDTTSQTQEASEYILSAFRLPTFLGVAFCCEGWKRTDIKSEEDRRKITTRFADMVGSVENRLVSSIDINGTNHMVSRDRGTPIEILDNYNDPGIRIAGKVGEALNLIIKAVKSESNEPERVV